jgi:H+/Cl- antiporter ClcA
MITIGAVFGRLYGHCLSQIGEAFGVELIKCKLRLYHIAVEGIYSVVGATCVYGAATKTVSTPIVIFELTG